MVYVQTSIFREKVMSDGLKYVHINLVLYILNAKNDLKYTVIKHTEIAANSFAFSQYIILHCC